MNQLDIYYRALLDYSRSVRLSPEHKAFAKEIIHNADHGTERIKVKRQICKIDESWVTAIEKGLEYIERAIKEERQFITSNGETVPIEKVKSVSRESVQHLARHSNLISREPDDGGNVTPDRLYTLERLNDYNVYENRFLYMLLCYLRDFVALRYSKIEESFSKYDGKLEIERTVVHAQQKLTYSIHVHDERKKDKYMSERDGIGDVVRRISYMLDAIHTYLSHPLMLSAAQAPMIKPPVTKTNILKMDKNFKGAVELYDFIISYDKDGYEIENDERIIGPFKDELADYEADIICALAFITYEYGLDINGDLKLSYEREEQRKRDEKIKDRYSQLEGIRRRMESSEAEPEEYIDELEQQIRLLQAEHENAGLLYDRIEALSEEKELKVSEITELNGRISLLSGELEKRDACHAEECMKLKKECDSRVSTLEKRYLEETERVNKNLEAVSREANVKIGNIREQSDVIREECAKALEKLEILENENLLLKAQLMALRAACKDSMAEEDLSNRDDFLQLEREKKAFDAFYKVQWRKAKKKIRSDILDPEKLRSNAKEENK